MSIVNGTIQKDTGSGVVRGNFGASGTDNLVSGTPSALTKTDDTNVTLTLGGTPATALLQPASLTLGWTGTLSGTRGGTGVNNGSNTIALGGNLTTSGAFPLTLTQTGSTNVTLPTSGTLATTSQLFTNPMTSVGDLIQGTTAGAPVRLASVATGNALISGGVTTASSWGKIGLTTHISGILPVANGGTNSSSASITAFNNITGYTASGATGTTSTNLMFSGSPTFTGTLTGGAFSGTTGGFSGLLTSTLGNNTTIFNSSSATTGYQYMNIQNTSGRLLWGVESSTGGLLGIPAYTSFIGSGTATGFTLISNGSAALTMSSAQVVGMPNLAGSGSRVVVADASGNLSAGGAAVTIASPVTLTGTGSIAPTAMISTYLVNPSATTVITITTSGLVAGQIINVKHITTANTTSVQGSSGNVDGAGSVDISVLNTNASLQWDGSNFWNLNK